MGRSKTAFCRAVQMPVSSRAFAGANVSGTRHVTAAFQANHGKRLAGRSMTFFSLVPTAWNRPVSVSASPVRETGPSPSKRIEASETFGSSSAMVTRPTRLET